MTKLPSSQLLTELSTVLNKAKDPETGGLPLNKSTLSGTPGADLLTLFSDKYNFSAGFNLTKNVTIGDVTGDFLQISGEGSYNDKTVQLAVTFADLLGEITIEALFSTPSIDDLNAVFTQLPTDFFNGIKTIGTNPTVSFPLGMPANITFSKAVYGVKGYFSPNQGYIIDYIVPSIQGNISVNNKNERALYLELPTDSSGWRAQSIDESTWTFDDLQWLLPEVIINENFPEIFNPAKVNLDFFQLLLVPTAPDFSTLYTAITDQKDPAVPLWTVFNGKIKLTSVLLAMSLECTKTSVQGTQHGWIEGVFEMGDTLISTQIPFPLNEGSWAVQAYPNLTPSKALKDLAHLLPDGSSFDTLLPAKLDTVLSAFTLSRLYVAIDGKNLSLQQFSFTVNTTNPWKLVENVLELDKLTVQMNIDGRGQITGGIQSHFLIGKSDVYLNLQKYTPGGDWYFIVNSPVIDLPSLGDLARLTSNAPLANLIQAAGLNSLQFLIFNLNLGLSIGKQTRLTNLGFTIKLSDGKSKTDPKADWEVIPGILTLREFSIQFQLDWKPALEAEVTGFFRVNNIDFGMKFGHDEHADAFIGAYCHSSDTKGLTVDIKSLVASICDNQDIVNTIPDGLDITLDDIFIGYVNVKGKGKKFIFAMDMEIEIPLSGIPLVGKALPKSAKVDIRDFKVVVASDEFSVEEVNAVNQLILGLPEDMKVQPLPAPASGETGPVIPKGFSIAARFNLGSQEILISAPATTKKKEQSQNAAGPELRDPLPAATAPAPVRVSDPASVYQSTMWINVQKSFGPVELEKVGFNYHDGKIYIMANIALNSGGLSIELLGFGIGSSLTKFDLGFTISGLAVGYQQGPLTVAGGMLGSIEPLNFTGALIINAEAFNFAAFAGYTSIEDQPSFFMYAVVNDPPIGPCPAFFITGFAAGFGFNRKLVLPDVSQVYTFPFVQWAVNNDSSPSMDPNSSIGDQVAKALALLKGTVAPKVGDFWIAGGLKFTNFELLSSFALLSVSLGTDFEIALTGVSSLGLPPPPEEPEKVAEVQMEIKVSFSPSSGLLSIAGQLTPNSYIFSKKIRLTGGFALYYWFAGPHTNEFLLSIGGYNSHFKVPAYYPAVPRLGISWQLAPAFSITGELYFALTETVVMAGGKLSAVWHGGPVRAWFTVWADFLIMFKPFHYFIDAGVDLGASFTIKLLFVRITTTIHIGVNLEIWGPDFSGKARVDLKIISFTISFGGSDKKTDTTLEWDRFVSEMLPSGDTQQSEQLMLAAKDDPQKQPSLVQIIINKGLIKKLNDSKENPMFLVCGKSFYCTIHTTIPSKDTSFKGEVKAAPDDMQPKDSQGNVQEPNNNFGAGPAGIKPDDFQTALEIDMETPEETQFLAVRNLKGASKALFENKEYDQHGVPKTDPDTALDSTSIENTLTGYTLVPFVTPPDHTLPIPKESLEFTLSSIQQFCWSTAIYPTTDDFNAQTVSNTITETNVTRVRAALLDAASAQNIMINKDINIQSLADSSNNDLMAQPCIRLLGEQKTEGETL